MQLTVYQQRREINRSISLVLSSVGGYATNCDLITDTKQKSQLVTVLNLNETGVI